MRLDPDGTVVLSRCNLRSLLGKLDGHPRDSACTIVGGDDAPGLFVNAEDDEQHYGRRGRRPRGMHPDTEAVL